MGCKGWEGVACCSGHRSFEGCLNSDLCTPNLGILRGPFTEVGPGPPRWGVACTKPPT